MNISLPAPSAPKCCSPPRPRLPRPPWACDPFSPASNFLTGRRILFSIELCSGPVAGKLEECRAFTSRREIPSVAARLRCLGSSGISIHSGAVGPPVLAAPFLFDGRPASTPSKPNGCPQASISFCLSQLSLLSKVLPPVAGFLDGFPTKGAVVLSMRRYSFCQATMTLCAVSERRLSVSVERVDGS